MLPPIMVKKGLRKTLDNNDIAAIVSNCSNPIYKTLFLFVYMSGARITEALDVRKADCLVKEPYLIVKVLTRKKRTLGEQRVLYFRCEHPFIQPVIEVIKMRSDPDERIWKVNRISAWRNLKWAAERAGFDKKKIWLHFLRTSRLTQLANNGATANELKAWAGWSDLKYAKFYVQETEQMSINVAEKMYKQSLEESKSNDVQSQ